MNELLWLPSRVLVTVLDSGVGIDDAVCDQEQVTFLGECTRAALVYPTVPTDMRMTVSTDITACGR